MFINYIINLVKKDNFNRYFNTEISKNQKPKNFKKQRRKTK